jgi:hypothetical protein
MTEKQLQSIKICNQSSPTVLPTKAEPPQWQDRLCYTNNVSADIGPRAIKMDKEEEKLIDIIMRILRKISSIIDWLKATGAWMIKKIKGGNSGTNQTKGKTKTKQKKRSLGNKANKKKIKT